MVTVSLKDARNFSQDFLGLALKRMDDIINFFLSLEMIKAEITNWASKIICPTLKISSCSTLFRFMRVFKLHLPPNCDRNTTFWLLIKHIQKVYVLVLISTRFVATCLSEGMIPPNHQCEPVAKVRSNWEPDVRVSFHCWPDVTCMGQIQLWTSWKGQFHLWTRCNSQFPLWTRCNLNRSDPTVNQLQGPVPIVNQMEGSDPKWEESNHFVSKWAWFKQAVKCQSFSVISLLQNKLNLELHLFTL